VCRSKQDHVLSLRHALTWTWKPYHKSLWLTKLKRFRPKLTWILEFYSKSKIANLIVTGKKKFYRPIQKRSSVRAWFFNLKTSNFNFDSDDVRALRIRGRILIGRLSMIETPTWLSWQLTLIVTVIVRVISFPFSRCDWFPFRYNSVAKAPMTINSPSYRSSEVSKAFESWNSNWNSCSCFQLYRSAEESYHKCSTLYEKPTMISTFQCFEVFQSISPVSCFFNEDKC